MMSGGLSGRLSNLSGGSGSFVPVAAAAATIPPINNGAPTPTPTPTPMAVALAPPVEFVVEFVELVPVPEPQPKF